MLNQGWRESQHLLDLGEDSEAMLFLRVPELAVDHQHGLGATGAEVRDGERLGHLAILMGNKD